MWPVLAIAHFATRLGYFDAAIPLVDGMLIQAGYNLQTSTSIPFTRR